MLDQFAELGMVFAVLTFIAMLVRYERRLSRWLVKGSRKRQKPLIVQVVRGVLDRRGLGKAENPRPARDPFNGAGWGSYSLHPAQRQGYGFLLIPQMTSRACRQ